MEWYKVASAVFPKVSLPAPDNESTGIYLLNCQRFVKFEDLILKISYSNILKNFLNKIPFIIKYLSIETQKHIT